MKMETKVVLVVDIFMLLNPHNIKIGEEFILLNFIQIQVYMSLLGKIFFKQFNEKIIYILIFIISRNFVSNFINIY
jgi:hypothetical protein